MGKYSIAEQESKSGAKQIYIFLNRLYPDVLKIGMSITPIKRLKSVQTSSGFPLSMEFESSAILNPKLAESLIHKKLEEYRLYGEWFKIDVSTAIEVIKDVVSKSESAEYKDLTEGYLPDEDCIKVFDYAVMEEDKNNLFSKFKEVQPFIYESTSYNYYVMYKQGELKRTARFCSLQIAIKFAKDNKEILLRTE